MIGKKNSSRGVKNQVRSAINKTGVMRLAVHAVPAAIAILRYHSVQEDRARFGNSVGELRPFARSKASLDLDFGCPGAEPSGRLLD